MKKLFLSLIAILTAFIFSTCALAYSDESPADSPLASTPFFKAYLDVPIVEHAQYMLQIDLEMAEYLTGKDNPIDVKAAVINAMMIEEEAQDLKTNYESYMAYHALRRGFPIEGMIIDEHFGTAEIFVSGYMKALDNVSGQKEALDILDGVPGREKWIEMEGEGDPTVISRGVTYNMVNALVKAQSVMKTSTCDAWKLVNAVATDKTLEQDMRKEAVDIIMDYMNGFKEDCK